MRGRVDFENKLISVSVRDLVETGVGAVRLPGLLGQVRAELGQQVHRRYRREREAEQPGFRAEVSVEAQWRVEGFTARLRGRIDGVIEIEQEGRLIVEEVKSVAYSANELEGLKPEDYAHHALQARLYALCLQQQSLQQQSLQQQSLHQPGPRQSSLYTPGPHGGSARPPVGARLLLYSLFDGGRRVVELEFDEAEAVVELEGLLRELLARATEGEERRGERLRLAERLSFPYGGERPHQAELTESVAKCLESRRPLLAMAPTGIGKTVAALIAGLRQALAAGTSLFYLTSKNTQQQLVESTFKDIAAASGLEAGSLRALTLRAKERMCATETLQCHPELCPYLKDFDTRAGEGALLDQLAGGRLHIDPDELFQIGIERMLCPFLLSVELLPRMDLIICDYNYVYDPQAALWQSAENNFGKPPMVIIDEAHNLFDRARGYHSPFLGRTLLLESCRELEGPDPAPKSKGKGREQLAFDGMQPEGPHPAILSDLRGYFLELTGFIDGLGREAEAEAEGETESEEEARPVEDCRPVRPRLDDWKEWAERAGRLMLRYAFHLHLKGAVRPRDPVLEMLGGVIKTREILGWEAPEFIPYSAGPAGPQGAGYGILCLNPAPRLALRHAALSGCVAMSATLSPLSYFSDVLGFSGLEPQCLNLPSPFLPEQRKVLIIPTVQTTYRRRAQNYAPIARLIEQVIGLRPGRYIAFFSSFAFLAAVRERLEVPPEELLSQSPAMAEQARRETLERMRSGRGPLLLLAVMGGIFAEGVDLPGEALIGAIAVGPGWPKVGFERDRMRRYYDQHHDNGFAYTMLYPGMQRVIQAAGRVIRTPDDRGAIVLLGRRFADPLHLECLPPDWHAHDPAELIAEEPMAELARFWEG